MPSPRLDKYALYELAVTNAAALARFLGAVHGRAPRVLCEDFSGTGALARAWVELSSAHRAIALDRDPAVLKRVPPTPGLQTLVADALRARARADVIAATNFPVGYLQTRKDLLAYLRRARARLRPRGVFVCDMYGGDGAFTPMRQRRRVRTAQAIVEYTWEQIEANAATGMVRNAIHFRVPGGRTLRNAFTYHWRLWSVPELRDAMLEAGYRRVDVYDRLGDGIDQDGRLLVRPLRDCDGLDPTWVAYVAGRKGR